jgi:hypothetical protein
MPLCQSVWITTERRYANKKDSTSRSTPVNAIRTAAADADELHANTDGVVHTNAVSAFNGNGSGGARGGSRFRGSGVGARRNNNMPQWVMNYCRQHRLCFRCKEAFHPNQPCSHPPKQLDDKLRPQSN